MKCVLRAWGQLQRGFEVLALGEMCFEGMGELQRGFEVLALGEMCFEGMYGEHNRAYQEYLGVYW